MTEKVQETSLQKRALAALNAMTTEEDAEITAAAIADPDAQPLSEDFMSKMRPVRDDPELLQKLQAAQVSVRRRLDTERSGD